MAHCMHLRCGACRNVAMCALASLLLAQNAAAFQTFANPSTLSCIGGSSFSSVKQRFSAFNALPLAKSTSLKLARQRSPSGALQLCATAKPPPFSEEAKPIISKVLAGIDAFSVIFGLSSVGLLASSSVMNGFPEALEHFLVGSFVLSFVVGTVSISASLTALLIEAVNQSQN